MRAKHDCALWIEHHMPKSSNQGEAPTPFGSSLWERWIEFGFALIPDPKDAGTFNLRTFTPGQRDERTWPESLTRGTEWPWRANWPPEIRDEIDRILLKQARARQAGAA
jgi:hypothetical protein